MEVSDFEQVIRVDLVSPFIVSKAVVKGMITRKSGKIINTCLMMSELGRRQLILLYILSLSMIALLGAVILLCSILLFIAHMPSGEEL